MKKILYTLICLIIATCFSNCSDDDDKGKVVNISVAEAKAVSSVMTISLKDNEPLKLTVHIMPTNAANKTVTFTSNNPAIFEVSNEGVITPNAIGKDTLYIHATDGSGALVRYVVNVIDHVVKVSSITIASDAQAPSIKIGGTFNLGAKITINPTDATDGGVTYTSSDESIAMVDANGIITAKAVGAAAITVKATDGSNVSATCNVTVAAQSQVDLDRSLWTAQTAAAIEGSVGGFNYIPQVISWIPDRYDSDKKVTGYPAHLFDGTATTYLAMLKPGKPTYNTGGSGWASYPEAKAELETMGAPDTGASATVDAGSVNYFIVDMQSPQTFSYVRWTHRNGTRGLQAWGIDIYGSNDGTAWSTKLNGNSPIQLNESTADKRLFITDAQDKFTYRYVKVVIASYDTVNSSNVQVGEFGLGSLE